MDDTQKMSKAKTKLLVNYPFWGSLSLSTQFIEDNSIPTMCTDGKVIKWSRDYVSTLTMMNCLYVIAHEVHHICLLHPMRRSNRDPKLWNIAADFAINSELNKAIGAEHMPEGGLYSPEYEGMSAEQIYKLLQDKSPEEIDDITGGGQDWDMGGTEDPKNDQGQPLSPAEAEQMQADITQKVMVAADAAKAWGKLPASIDDLITVMRRSEVDLETVVCNFVGGDNPDNYTYRRMNRRNYMMHDVVTPTIECSTVGHTVVAIDSSMSVSDNEQEYFLGLVNHFIDDKQPESVTIMTWTTSVRTVKTYEKGEHVPVIAINDRGGTAVSPVFKYIEEENVPCDQLIVLSDLQIGDYPKIPAAYPVLWVSSYLRATPAPWGKTTWMKAA